MSGLFGKRLSNAQQPQQPLSGMRINTSLYNLCVAICYGWNRLSPNLAWYDDFKKQELPQQQSGKGGLFSGGKGSQGKQYTYFAAVLMSLCEGPMGNPGHVWDTSGTLQVAQAQENFTVPGGGGSYTVTHASTFYDYVSVFRQDPYSVVVNDYGSDGPVTLSGTQAFGMSPVAGTPGGGQYSTTPGHYTFSAADAGKVMVITYAYSTASDGSSPVAQLNLVVLNGNRPQSPWAYLVSNHHADGKDLAYNGIAMIAHPSLPLGQSAMLPNLSIEVRGTPNITGDGNGDCYPDQVVTDFLTNPLYGAGWVAGDIGSLTQFKNYCLANGIFISPLMDAQRQASDWLQEILTVCNSESVWSGAQLKLIPYGDRAVVGNGVTFVPATQPIYDLTDDDFQPIEGSDPVKLIRPTVQDAYNSITVEYLNRLNSYNAEPVEARDQNSVELYGLRPQGPQTFHMIKRQAVAALVAQSLLSRSVSVRNQYEFTVSRRYILLEPMDTVTLTDAKLNLNKMPVRLKTIEEQDNGDLKMTAEEFLYGTSSPTLYPKQTVVPGSVNTQAEPGPVNAPIMFEAVSRLNDQIGHSIFIGLSGANAFWGGVDVYVSLDNSSYKWEGRFEGRSRTGTLTAALATAADPDTTHSFTVDLTESLGTLSSGTAAECDEYLTLCWVDGELISYQNATLVSPNTYTLGTRIRRGIGGSTIGTHAIGSRFLRVDDFVFQYNFDPSMIGKTIYFKFTSFNLWGIHEEDISTVTAYPITITGSSMGLLMPAHVTYRPTSNPLTAHANGTISVAAFSMRIPGIPDIPLNSATLSSLSLDTLYYVYYDDFAFAGQANGPVTYVATTTKETALAGAGRFFVGSVRVPAANCPDNQGNGDGGSGAQVGGRMRIPFPTAVNSAAAVGTAGGATVTNFAGFTDGSLDSTGSASQLTVPGNGAGAQASLGSASFGSVINGAQVQQAVLYFLWSVPTNTLPAGAVDFRLTYTTRSASGGFTQVNTNPGVTGGVTNGVTLTAITLPSGLNLSDLTASINILTTTQPSGQIVCKAFGCWLEITT